MRLPEIVLGMTVTGNSPEDDDAFDRAISTTDRDMILKADPGTITMVPWAVDPTAQVIHDCYFADGRLVDFAPRSVLRRVLKLYSQKGWKPLVAPELEFYLTAKNIDPDLPLAAPVGRSGRSETSRQVYSIDAVNEFDPLFEDIYDYCDMMGLDVDTLIHEIGAGQMEINFQHGEPWAWPTRSSSTICTPPSWPSRWLESPARRCTCTRAWSTARPARISSARTMVRPRSCSAGISAACRSTCRRRWRSSRPT
jgi:hypothetical protein